MIYDSSESVTVEKEAQFIREYVELMRLRLGDSCRLEYILPDSLPLDARIAPLLYVTLVENAFKHSVANETGYFIRISLYTSARVDKCHRSVECLVFKVENTYSEAEKENGMENKHLGVGLPNVRKQLDLLYPGVSSFEIDTKGGIYTATILIETSVLKNMKSD